MIYRCSGCGANPVYDPEKKMLVCPACGGENTGEIDAAVQEDKLLCPNCSGELQFEQFTAAERCPYCNNYLIFDEFVTGDYEPKMISPFRIGKDKVTELMKERFSKQKFAPKDLLSAASLDKIRGVYVPFWFYDYDAQADYKGEGRFVEKKTANNVETTTTKHYEVVREIEASFSKIPVDASDAMPDATMDLLAPFDYADTETFDTKYLSGFSAEYYNHDAKAMKGRADAQMKSFASRLVRDKAQTGKDGRYDESTEQSLTVTEKKSSSIYGLMPVWKYDYKYHGEEYPFYINGQTGKIVGKAPLAKERVWAAAGIVFAVALVIGLLLWHFANISIIPAIAIPAVIALIFAGINLKPSAGTNTVNAQTYLDDGRVTVKVSTDRYLRTTTEERKLNTGSNS